MYPVYMLKYKGDAF